MAVVGVGTVTDNVITVGSAFRIGVDGWRASGIAWGTPVTVTRIDHTAHSTQRCHIVAPDGRHADAFTP